MRNPVTKPLLAASALAAAVALMPMAAAQAQVQCRTDGYRWHCQDYAPPVPAPAWRSGAGWANDNPGGSYGPAQGQFPGPAPVYDNPY